MLLMLRLFLFLPSLRYLMHAHCPADWDDGSEQVFEKYSMHKNDWIAYYAAAVK